MGEILASVAVGAAILPIIGLEKWWRGRRPAEPPRELAGTAAG